MTPSVRIVLLAFACFAIGAALPLLLPQYRFVQYYFHVLGGACLYSYLLGYQTIQTSLSPLTPVVQTLDQFSEFVADPGPRLRSGLEQVLSSSNRKTGPATSPPPPSSKLKSDIQVLERSFQQFAEILFTWLILDVWAMHWVFSPYGETKFTEDLQRSPLQSNFFLQILCDYFVYIFGTLEDLAKNKVRDAVQSQPVFPSLFGKYLLTAALVYTFVAPVLLKFCQTTLASSLTFLNHLVQGKSFQATLQSTVQSWIKMKPPKDSLSTLILLLFVMAVFHNLQYIFVVALPLFYPIYLGLKAFTLYNATTTAAYYSFGMAMLYYSFVLPSTSSSESGSSSSSDNDSPRCRLYKEFQTTFPQTALQKLGLAVQKIVVDNVARFMLMFTAGMVVYRDLGQLRSRDVQAVMYLFFSAVLVASGLGVAGSSLYILSDTPRPFDWKEFINIAGHSLTGNAQTDLWPRQPEELAPFLCGSSLAVSDSSANPLP